ncbi:MAG: hypothetical protein Kow0010_11670 [Dehalococcoidia bacterium]
MTRFHQRAVSEIGERQPAETLTPIMRNLVTDSAAMLRRTAPADARQRAAEARAYAIEHLEELHAQLRARLEARGIGYHRVDTPEQARELILGLLAGSRRVAKSKSMVAEEIGLTHYLRASGLDVLETDIGEYIVDIEGRGPSHITAPALHLNRSRIREMLGRAGAELADDDPERLSRHVRDVVGDFFAGADAGITGVNVAIASSGRLGIVENEGNVALGVSRPPLHIAVTGLEKVVADEAGALAVLQVLAPSATAQPLTAFTHLLAEPAPGQKRHVVFVDNGRSRIARDTKYRDVLRCIRCGACMNTCPVYRAAGGLAYGSPYMGPIGAVLSPLLWPDGRFADLPFASSLCAACTEVCPVGIPLHRMLLDLRADAVDAGYGTRAERGAWRAWARAFRSRTMARLATRAIRLGLRAAAPLRRGNELDRRRLPAVMPTRDPAMLHPAGPMAVQAPPRIDDDPSAHDDPVSLFRGRATALGVAVVDEPGAGDGDRVVAATAGIASTGSVLLVDEAADRRALLEARRLVVTLDPARLVRHPEGLAAALAAAKGDALILTGASRTADIEKQIVRGIHGPAELVVVLQEQIER